MKLDVLALAAHPDDTELCCNGILASLIRQNHRVGVLDLTHGEMGTRGTPEQRLQEARRAAEVIGLYVRENLGLPDCHLENTTVHRESIIRTVRRLQPDICLINAPDDRHPDHRNACRLQQDALFYAGLSKLLTHDDDGNEQKPWRPYHILHYMQTWPFTPSLVYDITDTIELKEKSILAFESQFYASGDDDEPQTFVSSKEFFYGLRARARYYGQMIGVEYGEPLLYQSGPLPARNLDMLFDLKPQT